MSRAALATRVGFVVLCAMLCSGPLHAADTVAISPLVEVILAHSTEDPAALATSAARGMLKSVVETPGFYAFDRQDLRLKIEDLPYFHDSLQAATLVKDLGFERYRELDLARAIEQLTQARESYRRLDWDLVSSEEYAEIVMFLVLALIESRGATTTILELLDEMIRYDPSRAFRAGFYSDNTVQLFEAARQQQLRQAREAGPGLQRSRRWAQASGAKYVLFSTIVEDGPTQFEVRTHVYDADLDAFLESEGATIRAVNPALVEDVTNRLTSRILSCLQEMESRPSEPVAASEGESPWSVHLHFAYASFLAFPEPKVDLFGNWGAGVEVGHALTREFSLHASFLFLNSIRDYGGYLANNFTTLRGFFGAALGYWFGPLHLSLGTSLELSTVGAIRVCPDENAIISGNCRFDEYGSRIMAGINLRPQAAYRFSRSFHFFSALSGTFYVYPIDDLTLNFPLTTSLGLQYRF